MEKNRRHFFILLGIYTIILIWGILLKTADLDILKSNFNSVVKLDLYTRLTAAPLNPFKPNFKISRDNRMNLIAFMPYGYLIAGLIREKKILKSIGLSLAFSLFLEVMQIFTAFGGFATDDLTFNTLGGAIGAIVFMVIDFLGKRYGYNREYEKITRDMMMIVYVCFVPTLIYAVAQTASIWDFLISTIEPMINSLW